MAMPPILNRVGASIARFRRDTRANIAITFALAAIPVLGAVGAATDYSLAARIRTKLQSAADTAAVAAVSEKSAGWTAAMQMSTSALQDLFGEDPLVQTAVHASGDMLVVPGGFPIVFGSGCVGGLGIAGGHYKEDHVVGERAFIAVKAAEPSKGA